MSCLLYTSGFDGFLTIEREVGENPEADVRMAADLDVYKRQAGDIERIKFPSPALRGDTFDFSFSGLKTAVINHVHNLRQRLGIGDGPLPEEERVRIAASFTDTVTEAIAEKVKMCIRDRDS